MRLLLDQNLSPRRVAALADLYPGSGHVRDLGLASAPAEEVWVYASADAGDSWVPIVRDLPAVLSVEVQTLP